MWRGKRKEDVVAASLAETQTARSMISESRDLLDDIESDLANVLTAASRRLLPRSETPQGA